MLALALPSLTKTNKKCKHNTINKMEWVNSVVTKWSKQKSNKSRKANARFFATKGEYNKCNTELSREVETVPRCTNIYKDSTKGGKFDTKRASTSGIVLVQNEFKFEVGTHKKNHTQRIATH